MESGSAGEPSYVGRQVCRHTADGLRRDGAVHGARLEPAAGGGPTPARRLFLVVYEDGGTEELVGEELRNLLVDEQECDDDTVDIDGDEEDADCDGVDGGAQQPPHQGGVEANDERAACEPPEQNAHMSAREAADEAPCGPSSRREVVSEELESEREEEEEWEERSGDQISKKKSCSLEAVGRGQWKSQHRFHGISYHKHLRLWQASIRVNRTEVRIGSRYETAEEAARAWDVYATQVGRTDLNFPNADGLDELREGAQGATKQAAQRSATPRRATTSPRYIGVERDNDKWRAFYRKNGVEISIGWFDTAEEAAHAYDEKVRAYGRKKLNFAADGKEPPRPRKPTHTTEDDSGVSSESESKEYSGRQDDGESAHGARREQGLASYRGLYRGVDYVKSTGKFRARIKVQSAKKDLGRFDTAEEAARAYDEMARTLGRTNLNFPAGGEQQQVREVEKPARYIGVRGMKSGMFQARITHNDKEVRLGMFETAEEAAHAFDQKDRELGRTNLNFDVDDVDADRDAKRRRTGDSPRCFGPPRTLAPVSTQQNMQSESSLTRGMHAASLAGVTPTTSGAALPPIGDVVAKINALFDDATDVDEASLLQCVEDVILADPSRDFVERVQVLFSSALASDARRVARLLVALCKSHRAGMI